MTALVRRARRFAIFLVSVLFLTVSMAPAAVDFATGIRHVVASGTLDDCNAKAKAALEAYLENANEPTPGEWIATGPVGPNMSPDITSAGTIHCYAHAGGYIVSFSCMVEAPNNPYSARALCEDLAANFEGTPQTPLATPTPPPSGCTTATLAGTWRSDSDNTLTLKMDQSGELTDSEDVVGSWTLSGNAVKLTYYGYHNMTLSADGKHLSGGGYSFTREC